MASKKIKKVRYFFLIFTFSFLAGSFFFIFENFGLLSLRDYILETPNADVEKLFWELLPSECIRYWPVMVFKSSQIRISMEKTIPVQVSTEAKGVGLFHTRISFIEPWLMVEWNGKIWHLSKESYMWAPELYSVEVANSPLWKISEALTQYFNIGNTFVIDGVFSAMLPLDELKRFEAVFIAQNWYADTEYIELGRRAGEILIKISLSLNGKKIILIINEDEDKLSKIDMFLEQILSQADMGDGTIFIDMSYPDKVVVTRAKGA